MHRHPTPRRASVATILVTTLIVAGCTTAAEPEPEADDTVEVRLVDYGFDGLPDEVAAGTQLTITNEADAELHELVAFRLPDDESRSVTELAQLPPEELMATLGDPVTVLLAEPGGETVAAVGDGTLTEPGRYAILCFIPTGVDPSEYLQAAAESEGGPPQVDGGPPHFVHGMIAELTVR